MKLNELKCTLRFFLISFWEYTDNLVCLRWQAYVWVYACVALVDTLCGYREKERKSESGLSVISVTLSERLHLTNERCWQPGYKLPWPCWVGQICFRTFVRFILPLLLSPILSLFLSFSLTVCQREQRPLVSPKDASWHSAWWQIDQGGQGVCELPPRWRGFECSNLPLGLKSADLVRMGKTGKRGEMTQCQKMSKIRKEKVGRVNIRADCVLVW